MADAHLVSWNHFCVDVSMRVCVYVSAPKGMNN